VEGQVHCAPACNSARGVVSWQPQVQALPGQRAQVQEGVVFRECMEGSAVSEGCEPKGWVRALNSAERASMRLERKG
jgi:hypothetical protein